MKVQTELRDKIKALKIGGKPLAGTTAKERMDAYYFARRLGYKIKSRQQISGKGFDLFRVK